MFFCISILGARGPKRSDDPLCPVILIINIVLLSNQYYYYTVVKFVVSSAIDFWC